MFRKVLLGLAVFSSAFSGEIQCEEPTLCCSPPPPCCWDFNPCNPKGCTDMNCGGFYVSADFLYWRAENHGFSYGFALTSTVPAVSVVGPNQNNGSILRVSPDWSPAFRLGLGWNSKYDFWDLFFDYTWYRNHSQEKQATEKGYIPLWLQNVQDRFGYNTASALFNMDMCDLELGRMTYMTKTISVRPHIGARGGILDQTFSNHFWKNLRTPPNPVNSEVRFNGENNYWGLGPRIGLDLQYHFSMGYSFIGKIASSLLYGQTKAEGISKYVPSGSDIELTNAKCKDVFYQLVPNLQFQFGVQWQSCFWCEKLFYKMSAAWEANYWWNQFNIPLQLQSAAVMVSPLPTIGNQPLTMEGLTLNMELDF